MVAPFIEGGRHPKTQARVRLFNVFSPLNLFSNGEQGAWYDPSDLTTLYQDSAGTTPVTADGDPVGLMLDKSGNDNHASQATSASRPVYRTDGVLHWLESDGIDDRLILPTSTIGGPSDSNSMFTASLTTSGFYLLGAKDDLGVMMLPEAEGFRALVHTGVIAIAGAKTGIFPRGTTVVGSSVVNLAAGTIDLHLSNGYTASTSFSPNNKTIPADLSLFDRGEQAISMYAGRFYGAIITNSIVSASKRSSTEQYLAQKSGVTL